MTSLRRLLLASLVWVVIAPSAAIAQDSGTVEDLLADLGTSLDDAREAEPNPSWDALGLFDGDSAQVAAVAAQPVAPITYAFGDDPNGTPILDLPGAVAVAQGMLPVRLPDDWVPPAAGLGTDMAFAQTTGRQVQPGDEVILFWLEYAEPYDFDPTTYINEGFPIALPGLPVWNSSFAGDTWEGANLIPNAVYGDGVLTFDVKSYQPPQSFPLVDLPGFYYRSGDIMAMALGAEALEAYAIAAGVSVDTNAAAATEGQTQTLLWTGGVQQTLAQDGDVPPPLARSLFSVLLFVRIFHYSHLTKTGQFQPGLIAYLDSLFGEDFTDWLMDLNDFFFPPTAEQIAEEAIDEVEEEAEEVVEEAADAVDDAINETDDAAEEAVAETDDPTDDATDDGGGLSLWILLIVIGIILLIAATVILRLMAGGTRKRGGGSTTTGGDSPGVYITDPLEGVPGVPPAHDPVPRRCGYEVKFDDGGGGNWFDVKALAANEDACCTYYVEVETVTIFDAAVSSFRQDAPAERLYIPAYEQVVNGIDWHGLTGTRSGPHGRQDWQHGTGDPVDTSDEGDPTSYFQGHQGEERPDVVCQTLHFEMTRVKAWLESGCPGHENRFDARGDVELDVVLSQECTNDNPGPACPVELNTFGGTVVAASGDLEFSTGYANGTDIDELERHLAAYRAMSPAEREQAAPPVLPVTGGWDGHDHATGNASTFPHQSHGSEHPIKDGDEWEAYLFTLSVSLNGQLVPVAVWPTTERVSTAMEVKPVWEVDLAAELATPGCDDNCAGHPDKRCHGAASFTLTMRGPQSTITGGAQTWTITRPDVSVAGSPVVPAGANPWEIGGVAAPGSTPAP